MTTHGVIRVKAKPEGIPKEEHLFRFWVGVFDTCGNELVQRRSIIVHRGRTVLSIHWSNIQRSCTVECCSLSLEKEGTPVFTALFEQGVVSIVPGCDIVLDVTIDID